MGSDWGTNMSTDQARQIYLLQQMGVVTWLPKEQPQPAQVDFFTTPWPTATDVASAVPSPIQPTVASFAEPPKPSHEPKAPPQQHPFRARNGSMKIAPARR